MSSARRIQASRANGALSKGPITPAGKIRSARNSLKHGLSARAVVPEEQNSPAFLQLLSALRDQFQPRDQREQRLVDSMALARWRTMRVWGLQTSALEHEMARQTFDEHDPATRLGLAFLSLCDPSRSARLLDRYETRYDRQFADLLTCLLEGRTQKLLNVQTDLIPPPDTNLNRRPA